MSKVKIIDIDSYESPEYKIKLEGKTYVIGDPKTHEAYKLMKLSQVYQDANENLQSNPDNETTQKVYEGAVKTFATEGLALFNDDVNLDGIELRKIEALCIKLNELSGEAFTKGRGLGI